MKRVCLALGVALVAYLMLFILSGLGWDLLGYTKSKKATQDQQSFKLGNLESENFNFNSFNSHTKFSKYIHAALPEGTPEAKVDDLLIRQGGAIKKPLHVAGLEPPGAHLIQYSYRSFKTDALSFLAMMPNGGWLVSVTYDANGRVVGLVASGPS